MKAVYTVGVRTYVKGATNAHGNPIDSWTEPVDLEVFSIGPRLAEEPDPSRTLVVVGLTLLAPLGTYVGPLDRVVVDAVEYEVDGSLADWNKGPFGFEPGVSIDLKRAGG